MSLHSFIWWNSSTFKSANFSDFHTIIVILKLRWTHFLGIFWWIICYFMWFNKKSYNIIMLILIQCIIGIFFFLVTPNKIWFHLYFSTVENKKTEQFTSYGIVALGCVCLFLFCFLCDHTTTGLALMKTCRISTSTGVSHCVLIWLSYITEMNHLVNYFSAVFHRYLPMPISINVIKRDYIVNRKDSKSYQYKDFYFI